MNKLMFELFMAQEMWEKTKQEKYKKEWYNLVQKILDYIKNYE